MDDKVSFKLAKQGDGSYAIELFNRIMNDGLNYLTNVYPFGEEDIEGYFGQNMKDNVTIFAIYNKQIVGWATLSRRSLKFQSHIGLLLIGILPEYQNIGMGNSLMAYVEKISSKIKIEKIEISVRKTSSKALNFFLKLGYVLEGEKINSVKTNYGYENELILGKMIKFNS